MLSLGTAPEGVTGITNGPSGGTAASCGGLSSQAIRDREGQGAVGDRLGVELDVFGVFPRAGGMHRACQRSEIIAGGRRSINRLRWKGLRAGRGRSLRPTLRPFVPIWPYSRSSVGLTS